MNAANSAGPGVVAFLIVAALGLALYFLIKSMNKQMSKIEVPTEAELRKAEREHRENRERGDRPDEPGAGG